MKKSPTLSSKDFLESQVQHALEYALSKGATSAAAEVQDQNGLNINVRNLDVETLEHTRDRRFSITVYINQRRGSASTGDLTKESIEQTVRAALDIANYTSEDPCAGLPEKELLCTHFKDLSLWHPWEISSEEAIELCKASEKAALEADPRIVNSEGSNLNTSVGRFVLGNTLGFCNGFDYSNHSIDTSVIAEDKSGKQVSFWYDMGVSPSQLASPESIGRKAAERAAAMLSAKNLSTRECPVIFDPYTAKSLIRLFVSAVSGSQLYRNFSFLTDSLGSQVFPEFLSMMEDPFIKEGYGSAPFDDEGVRPSKRFFVENGLVKGYFLSSYSARKLGMTTTGNAGGPYNISLYADKEHQEDTLEAMMERMGRGLIVTSLIGQGVNLTTGDYSRGAKGFWVENGEIAYPVDGITVAGNLRNMFRDVEAIGQDILASDNYRTGSILIKNLKIAGN